MSKKPSWLLMRGFGSEPFAWVVAVLLALLTGAGCSSGDDAEVPVPPAPRQVAVLGPDAPESGLAIALTQTAGWLRQVPGLRVVRVDAPDLAGLPGGTFVLSVGPSTVTDGIIPAAERAALKANGYILRTGEWLGFSVLAGAGPDDLGNQYAAYEMLTRMGFGFYHPTDTYVPAELAVPARPVDETWTPDYAWRGVHMHTQHPNEYVFALLVASEEHLEEARRAVDWVVANRQNYFRWALLATADMDTWIPHARRIVEYGHARGIRMGIDAPLEFKQENAYPLVPDAVQPWEPQLKEHIDRVMQAGWDVLHVEMGAAEFVPTSDVKEFDMMNYAGDYLAEAYGAQLSVKVHCTANQTAPNFGNINFNFLPGLCVPSVGVDVHTVQFYNLYEPAPTYGNESFLDWRTFLLDQAGRRLDLYYPETGYFITFDVSVPLFLPAYLYSRWLDLHNLEGSGIDGQINFTSGLEWGYWLNNYAAMGYAYDATAPWQDYLQRFTRIFGEAAGQMQQLLVDVTEEQNRDLIDRVLQTPPEQHSLMGYLIGHNTVTDLGRMTGNVYIPTRIEFSDVYEMDAEGLASFDANELALLEELGTTYRGFAERAEAVGSEIPERACRWYREIRRGIQVTGLRAEHMLHLYRGVVFFRAYELGLDPDGAGKSQAAFGEAIAIRNEALALILEQQAEYRAPFNAFIAEGPLDNPSVYKYGLFYEPSIAFYWVRSEARAMVPQDSGCFCLMNIDRLLDSFLGETWDITRILDTLLIALFGDVPCLQVCVEPVIPPEPPPLPPPRPPGGPGAWRNAPQEGP